MDQGVRIMEVLIIRKLTDGLLCLIEIPHEVRVSEQHSEDGLHVRTVYIIEYGAANMLRTATGYFSCRHHTLSQILAELRQIQVNLSLAPTDTLYVHNYVYLASAH